MRTRFSYFARPSLPLALIVSLMALLLIAGGASRGDVLGQSIVRAGAFLAMAITILFGPKPDFSGVRPILFIIIAAIAIPFAQMIPLPPSLWSELAGPRDFNASTAPAVWRPLSIVPGGTINSIASLIVPAAFLVLISQVNRNEYKATFYAILASILIAVFVALIQFSGSGFDNPFVNDSPGVVSSVFPNRNHFALVVAMGCLLVSFWLLDSRIITAIRGAIAATLVALFLFVTLAVGSRTGLVLFALAVGLSTAFFMVRVVFGTGRRPRMKLLVIGIAALFVVISLLVWIGFSADRVETIDRLLAASFDDDLRARTRSTLMDMMGEYLPFGSGLGSFDAAFRFNEPLGLLGVQYFNQAHNDYLGIALDAGLPGIVLVALAIAWWAFATMKVLRAGDTNEMWLARLGSGLLLLIFVASATDYPARTPIIMAITLIAASWLSIGVRTARTAALPKSVSAV